ncbi:MAG: T9SS type A sorting domain-containing protein [Chlorobi bacterium]|nr:T9SS type A sorting domain-containing protein [Chlorobiota bacterium]MCI0714977.1 T9SS type A sorting domain-containing protein [Chlorobiota bacterium]
MGLSVFLRILTVFTVITTAGIFFFKNEPVTENDISKTFVSETDKKHRQNFIPGPQSFNGDEGFPETVEQIMERDKYLEPQVLDPNRKRKEPYPDRRNLPQHPDAKPESTYPPLSEEQKRKQQSQTENPQTIGTDFTGITLSEAGFLPADNMGAAGPTQYIAIANGRIKTFAKSTGSADGVLNTTTDNFFNSVRDGAGTSDPRIRYDRMSQKWFVVIINVSSPNRILLAVSNTSTITVSTTWTFYFISAPSRFYDYPTLGIDNNALYIGTNDFNTALTAFLGCSGYVVNKADLISGTLTEFLFSLVPNTSSDGPYTPQGVDNFDASAAEGYFIGVSFQFFGSLVVRRVSNPGGVPSISSNISIAVNTTTFPISVPHLGMIGSRPLDALDDRLFAACLRNGRLWTAHNIEVNSSGVATVGGGRNGTRWYELTSLTGTPTVFQSGTIFDAAGSNPISYWIPTVMVSGQGHAAIVFSSAGNNARINVSTAGRLSGDVLGTTQSIVNITSSSTAYNVQVGTQRWGDYSYVSLDPDDDMTMWSVEGFCNASNSWGERVTRLLAPAPTPLTSAVPNSLTPGQPSVDVVITGTPASGEEFYDPGSGFTNRISASINGGVTVNSTTYNSSTQVTLNVSTVGATSGPKTVTITNPDGQFVSSSTIFDVPLPVVMASFTHSVSKRDVTLKWTTTEEINNSGFDIERQSFNRNNEAGEWIKIVFVNGHGNSSEPNDYEYKDLKLETGKYNYRLKQIDFNGNYERFNLPSSVLVGKPSISELTQNYPNPFNPLTKIDYGLSSDGKVTIVIYDIIGRVVARLVDEVKSAGYYTAEFNASSLASGVYFYRISSHDFTQVRKMLLVK